MKVYGVEVTDEQLEAATGAMRGAFTAFAIECALIRKGVPSGAVSSRAADRLLQRERKAGRIKTHPNNKRQWIATGDTQ